MAQCDHRISERHPRLQAHQALYSVGASRTPDSRTASSSRLMTQARSRSESPSPSVVVNLHTALSEYPGRGRGVVGRDAPSPSPTRKLAHDGLPEDDPLTVMAAAAVGGGGGGTAAAGGARLSAAGSNRTPSVSSSSSGLSGLSALSGPTPTGPPPSSGNSGHHGLTQMPSLDDLILNRRQSTKHYTTTTASGPAAASTTTVSNGIPSAVIAGSAESTESLVISGSISGSIAGLTAETGSGSGSGSRSGSGSGSGPVSPIDDEFQQNLSGYHPVTVPETFGRSSSRYYDKMMARSWLPSSKPSRNSVHIPNFAHPSIGINGSSKFGVSPGQSPAHSPAQGSRFQHPPTSPPMTPLDAVPPIASSTSSSSISTNSPSHHGSFSVPNPTMNVPKPRSTSFPSSERSGSGVGSAIGNDQDRRPSLKSIRSNAARSSQAHLFNLSNDPEEPSTKEESQRLRAWENAAPPLALYVHSPRIFGEAPPDLAAHTCTQFNDKLYIFGGRNGDGDYNNTLYVFNCTSSTLSTPKVTGDVPPPMSDMTATRMGSEIFYFGGKTADRHASSTVYKLSLTTLKFRKLVTSGTRPMPSRYGHTTVVSDLRFYVFGGFDSQDRPLNDVWKFDFGHEQNTIRAHEVVSLDKDTDLWPSARGHHTAHFSRRGSITTELDHDLMVVFGGNDRTAVLDDTWMFNFQLEKWSQLGDTVIKRAPPGSERAPSVVGIGNESPDSPFLTATATTSSLANGRPRTMHCSLMSGKYLLIYGGHDGRGFINTFDILNLKTRRWTLRRCNGIRNVGSCQHSAISTDSRLYIYGGFDSDDSIGGMKIMEMPLLPFVFTG